MGWLSHKLSEILSATHCTHDSSFPDNLHTKLHNGSTIKKTYKQGSRPAQGINFEASILAACMSMRGGHIWDKFQRDNSGPRSEHQSGLTCNTQQNNNPNLPRGRRHKKEKRATPPQRNTSTTPKLGLCRATAKSSDLMQR